MATEGFYRGIHLKECSLCGKKRVLSGTLGICLECIRLKEEALEIAISVHRRAREAFGLPGEPPEDEQGVPCPFCINQCLIPEGGYGYCKTKKNEGGKLIHIFGRETAKLDYYYDPIPTNCVAQWICAAGGCGYPEYSYTKGEEYGYKNLAVFYRACTFNCLFCQNWHFKSQGGIEITPDELACKVDERTSCICYFGGDPASQVLHSIMTSRKALRLKRIIRICWETNGSVNPKIMERMAEIALSSGGTIKIDLKAIDPGLHRALTGSSNKWTVENIKLLAGYASERKAIPLLVVNVLLVPGYIDLEEIRNISELLVSLDRDIPLSLLGFYPNFYMSDLPRTSKKHAYESAKLAKELGLTKVKIGNPHLLW